MALTFIVTNAGRAALVNAANTGTAPVVIAQVGISATALAPTPATAALPGEFKRLATLSGDVVADDTIHLIVRDESSDVFTVRSIALYLGDGTLFGLHGQAPVLIEKSAQAMMLLGIDVRFEDIAATNITFGDANFLNPPATTEQIGVVELATVAEAQAGIDALRSLTPAAAKAAVLGWLLAQDGAGSGLDADLLDGQDGNYYSNISARLGFTPVQQGTGVGQGSNTVRIGWSIGGRLKATIDATDQGNLVLDGNLAGGGLGINGASVARNGFHLFGPDNDGSGSGLDADLLDGQDGSYYSNIIARLGYTPLNKAGDTMTGALATPALEVTSGDIYISRTTTAWGYIIRPNVAGYRNLQFAVSGGGALDNLELNSLNVTIRTNAVWHSGNDGAGSGLDADLLDGQDGSYYSNITARLGYTPANKAGDTFTGNIAVVAGASISAMPGANAGGLVMTPGDAAHTGYLSIFQPNGVRIGYVGFSVSGGVMRYVSDNGTGHGFDGGPIFRNGNLVWDAGNDGAGSGLDADLLDGKDSSGYAQLDRGATFSGTVDTGGDLRLGRTSNAWGYIIRPNVPGFRNLGFAADGANSLDQANFTTALLTRNGSVVWDAGNDGSGSGLDADLLDGYQAAALVKYADFTKATNYEILPDGRILQWGFADALPTRTTTTITFPIAFPNGALQMLASLGTALTLTENRVGCGAAPISNTQGNIALPANFAGTIGVTWLAIGH